MRIVKIEWQAPYHFADALTLDDEGTGLWCLSSLRQACSLW